MLCRAIQNAIIILLLVNATRGYAQSNPVFLIGAGPHEAHYEVLPPSIKETCKGRLGNDEIDPFTVYAHIRTSNYEYYVEWGDVRPGHEEYDRASLLMIHENKCINLDLETTLGMIPANGGYSPTAAQEKQLVRPLIKDAIKRAIIVYGGDAAFRVQACNSQVEKELSNAGYVIVRQELKAYCSTVPGK